MAVTGDFFLSRPKVNLTQQWIGKYIIAHNGKAVYSDDYHLSASGSLLLTDMLRPAFEVMKQGK
jgi:hypothetical protein